MKKTSLATLKILSKQLGWIGISQTRSDKIRQDQARSHKTKKSNSIRFLVHEKDQFRKVKNLVKTIGADWNFPKNQIRTDKFRQVHSINIKSCMIFCT